MRPFCIVKTGFQYHFIFICYRIYYIDMGHGDHTNYEDVKNVLKHKFQYTLLIYYLYKYTSFVKIIHLKLIFIL